MEITFKYNQEDNTSETSRNGETIAKLNFNTDKFEAIEEMTGEEADEYYFEMYRDRRAYMSDVDWSDANDQKHI